MNTIRPVLPRALRPHLSLRYQHLRRFESSTATPPPSPAYEPPTPPPPPPKPFLRRHRSPLIWSTLGLALGLMAGNLVSHIIAPPAHPAPGSREDALLLADLQQRIDSEWKVQVLRGKCLGVQRQLRGEEGRWMEIIPSPTTAATHSRADHLAQHLQSASGLGVERVFWDRLEQKLVAVVWFGGALSGWPGVTHGGAIATALAEKLALAAALAQRRRLRPEGEEAAMLRRMPGTGKHAVMFAPDAMPDEPEQLGLSYVKPTHANNFYLIRVAPANGVDDEAEGGGLVDAGEGVEYEATLETLDGQTRVKATARFKRAGALQRVVGERANVVGQSYAEFKEWMWPSRQKNSQLK